MSNEKLSMSNVVVRNHCSLLTAHWLSLFPFHSLFVRFVEDDFLEYHCHIAVTGAAVEGKPSSGYSLERYH